MNNTPRFAVAKRNKGGKPAVELIIHNATYNQELDALTTHLGYAPTPMLANRRSLICTTPEQIDAARNPIAKFFNARGEWKI